MSNMHKVAPEADDLDAQIESAERDLALARTCPLPHLQPDVLEARLAELRKAQKKPHKKKDDD